MNVSEGLCVDGRAHVAPIQVGDHRVGGKVSGLGDVQHVQPTDVTDSRFDLAARLVGLGRGRCLGGEFGLALGERLIQPRFVGTGDQAMGERIRRVHGLLDDRVDPTGGKNYPAQVDDLAPGPGVPVQDGFGQ